MNFSLFERLAGLYDGKAINNNELAEQLVAQYRSHGKCDDVLFSKYLIRHKGLLYKYLSNNNKRYDADEVMGWLEHGIIYAIKNSDSHKANTGISHMLKHASNKSITSTYIQEIAELWKKAGEKRTLSLEERESIHSKLFQELKRLGLENPLTGYRYDFNQWLCLCVNATMKNAHETDGAGKRNGTTAEERRQFKLKKFVQEFYKENKVIPTLVQTMIGLKWDEKKVTNTINNGKIDFKEVIEEDLQDLEANGRFQTASIEALQEAGFQAEEFEQRDMETEISLKDLMLALKGHVDPVEIDKKTGEIKKPKRSHENANLYFAMRAIAFHEVITEDMVKRDAAGNILFRNKRVVNGARERIIKVPVIVATGYNKKEATTSDLISTIKYRRMLAGIDKEPIELKVWDITQIKQKIGNYMHQVGICPVNTMEEEPALSM